MTSILNARLDSEDEVDDDYDPAVDKTAEPADRAQFVKPKPGRKRKQGGRGRGRGRGAAKHQVQVQQIQEASAQVEEEQNQQEEAERAAKRAKLENVWQSLKQKGHSNLNSQKSKAIEQKMKDPGFTYLFTLCNSQREAKESKQQDTQTEGWMKIMGMSNKKKGKEEEEEQSQKSMKSLAAEALQKLKEAENGGKIKIVETRRFAGQQIQVEKQVVADSAEAQQAQEKTQAPKSSLEAAVSMINQDKKITVVDKSRADWDGYKHQNKQVEEELETYKKSGDTYLDKKQFLAKADIKQYEKERDQKLAADIRTRSRI